MDSSLVSTDVGPWPGGILLNASDGYSVIPRAHIYRRLGSCLKRCIARRSRDETVSDSKFEVKPRPCLLSARNKSESEIDGLLRTFNDLLARSRETSNNMADDQLALVDVKDLAVMLGPFSGTP